MLGGAINMHGRHMDFKEDAGKIQELPIWKEKRGVHTSKEEVLRFCLYMVELGFKEGKYKRPHK